MPDIVIEVLAASHPMLLDNRRAAHFIICALLSMLTFASCVPGGAKVVSVIAAHQNIFRLVLLVVEAMAILQFYGVRRLCIDSKLMTDEEPGLFVRFCWTSVIPITFICAIWAKLAPEPLQERRYPLWLRVMLAWLDVVELSFIPVFAIVLILATKLNLHDSLAPLPTWGPVNWELCMKYRQTLVAEGLDKKEQEAEIRRKPVAELAAPPPTPKRRHSRSISSSDVLGTHLILTTDAKVSPMTSDWRYDSSEETKGESPVKFRSPPNEVVPESGTLAVSRHPSSMWRSIKAKVNRVVISTPVSLASKLSHSAEVAAKATENHKRERAAAGLPAKTTKEPVDEAACIAADLPSPSPPMGGRETDAKPPQVVTPAIECDVLVRDMGDPLENVAGPVDPAIGHHPPPGQSSPDTIPQPSPPSPIKLPSASLLPLPESTYHGVLPLEHVAEAREKKTPGAESHAPLLIGESRAFVPAGEETPREAVVAASPRLEPHLSPEQSAVSMPEPSPQCEEPKLAVAMNGSLEARARQPECASPAQNTAVPPLPGCSQADGGVGALPRGDAVDVKAPQPQDRADARKTVRSPASPGPHHVRKGHRQKRHLELPDRRAKKSKPGEAFSPAVVVLTPPGAPSDQSVAPPIIWPEAKSAGATETVPNDRVPLSAPISPAVKAKRDRKNKSLVTSPVHPKGAGTTSKSTVQTHSQALDAQYAEQGALSATLSSKGNDNSSSAAPSGAQSPKHKKRKATARKGPFKERAHRRRTPEQATLSPGTPDGKTARAAAFATPTTKSPSPLVSGADSVAPEVLPLLSPAPQVSGSLEQLNCRPADTNGDFRDLAGTPHPHGSAVQPANTTAPQAPPGDDISPLSRQGASPSSQPTQSPPVASPPNRPTQSPRSAEPAENGAVDANRDPASAGQVHRHHKRAKMEHLEKKNAGTSSAHGLHGRPKNSEPKDYHRAK
ncbi:uncharacterized protein LOC144145132 [Haemaphysalis longicornis]